jgi:hypothetical protein
MTPDDEAVGGGCLLHIQLMRHPGPGGGRVWG